MAGAVSPDGAGAARELDGRRYAGRAGVAGWLLFDAAAQPWFTLVTTFVFGPYFASALAATPAEGQSLWGLATGISGVVIALLSPLLGAVSDAGGRRKPWVAVFAAMTIASAITLWWGVPGEAGAVTLVLVAFGIGTIGAEFATVFTNAMMPSLVPAARLGRLSGTGWAVGNVGGLVSLVLVLGLMAANPETGRTLFGLAPILGLDPAMREGDRFSGPFSALWFAVLVLPFFLFTPDGARRMSVPAAFRQGLSDLRATIAALPEHRDVLVFLVARLAYTDGLIALFAFGGIYAAGTLYWQTVQIGLFGILLTVTGTVGAYIGGRLDDWLGPKRVIVIMLWALIFASLGVLSVDGRHVFFVLAVTPITPGGPLFSTPQEVAYLAFGGVIGFVVGPLQAASRTLLIRLAPADRLTQFFGLYAFSGKMTSFLGPFAVAGVTALFADQRIGISSILVFFLVGAALLVFVPKQK